MANTTSTTTLLWAAHAALTSQLADAKARSAAIAQQLQDAQAGMNQANEQTRDLEDALTAIGRLIGDTRRAGSAGTKAAA